MHILSSWMGQAVIYEGHGQFKMVVVKNVFSFQRPSTISTVNGIHTLMSSHWLITLHAVFHAWLCGLWPWLALLHPPPSPPRDEST